MKSISFLYDSYNSIVAALKSVSVNDYNDLLVQVYTTNSTKESIKRVQKDLKKALNSPKIIGTTAVASLFKNRVIENDTVISIVFFQKSTVKTALLSEKNISSVTESITDETKLIFLLSSFQTKSNIEILEGVSQSYKDLPIIGGVTVDRVNKNSGYVFNEDVILEDGAICGYIDSNELSVTLESLFHWQGLGEEMKVTKANNSVISEIDNVKILDIYRHYLGEEIAQDILITGREFPLILQENNFSFARTPKRVLEDDSLLFSGDISSGDKVRFGFGDLAEIEKGVVECAKRLKKYSIESIFSFSSFSRKEYLKDDYSVELALLNSVAPTSGLVTFGEFFYLDGKNRVVDLTTSFVGLTEDKEEVNRDVDYDNLILSNNRTLKALTNLVNVTTKDLNDSLHHLKQFRDAVEDSTIYSITDPKGVIKYANKNFAQLAEYSQEELQGKPHNIVRHPDMSKEAFSGLWRTIQSGRPWKGTVKNKKKSGGHYYVLAHVFPIFDRDGNLEEYISIRNDITEEEERKLRLEGDIKIAEKSKEDSLVLLSQYENIIDTSSAIVRFDRNNTITYVNRGFCEFHRCPAVSDRCSELIGRKIAEIYDKQYFKKNAQKIYRKILKKKIWSGLTKNATFTGEIYYAETTISPILDVDGNLVEHMVVFHDVTDLITAQKEIYETQKDIIFKMGAIGEVRSKETGNHVKRVAEYSYLLAKELGFSQEEASLLKIASPMHDIGKVGISDDILSKPSRLTEEEFAIMKTHAEVGYEMLKGSKREILKTAAIVAREHHERYDGKGYPRGLKAEEIHIYGRITAIADVFDALSTKRVYKDPWDLTSIQKLIKEERGGHFDPKIADVFLKNFEKIVKIMRKHED